MQRTGTIFLYHDIFSRTPCPDFLSGGEESDIQITFYVTEGWSSAVQHD